MVQPYPVFLPVVVEEDVICMPSHRVVLARWLRGADCEPVVLSTGLLEEVIEEAEEREEACQERTADGGRAPGVEGRRETGGIR